MPNACFASGRTEYRRLLAMERQEGSEPAEQQESRRGKQKGGQKVRHPIKLGYRQIYPMLELFHIVISFISQCFLDCHFR